MWVLMVCKVRAESEGTGGERSDIQTCACSIAIWARPWAAFPQQFMSYQQHFAFPQVDVLQAEFLPLGRNNKWVWLGGWFDRTEKEKSQSF